MKDQFFKLIVRNAPHRMLGSKEIEVYEIYAASEDAAREFYHTTAKTNAADYLVDRWTLMELSEKLKRLDGPVIFLEKGKYPKLEAIVAARG